MEPPDDCGNHRYAQCIIQYQINQKRDISDTEGFTNHRDKKRGPSFRLDCISWLDGLIVVVLSHDLSFFPG